MHLLSINELLANRAVTAICWTLFHSLWQGLIAALLAALILIWTKQSRPTLRYQLLTTLFFVSAFLFAATLLYELQHSATPASGQATNGGKTTMPNLKIDHPVIVRVGGQPLLYQKISGFLTRNSAAIVTIWLIILSVRTARMFFVLGYTRHIVRHKSHEPSHFWRLRVTLLCHELRITRPVTLLESKIAKLPIVFGQLKPVILLPVGLLTQLAPEQIEAILLHELAHIRRGDYLVNLLQNIIEILLFFNPALLWLSSLIRDERENCCDDVAIGQLRSKKQYVESLISFKERSLYGRSLSAVGFAGRKSSYLNRISRIVENRNYTLSPVEKGSLVCSTIVAASLALMAAVPNRTTLTLLSPQSPKPETISRGSMVILRKYADTLNSAERLTSTVRRKTRIGAGPQVEKKDTFKFSYSLKLRDTVPPPPPPPPPQPDFTVIFGRMNQVIGDLVREKLVPDSASVQSFALDKNVFVVNDQVQSDAFHQKFITKYNIKEMGLYYGPEKVQGHGYFFNKKLASPGMSSPRMERPMRPMHYVNLNSIFTDVVDGLVTEGIITDKSAPVSYLLTNRKLIVNGQLQPESIHQRLKEKYVTPSQYTLNSPEMVEDPDFGLHYNSQTGASGIGIHHWSENQLP
jgi:beta-lactamase regulating signal transducer with metallopeptidase domain